MKWIKLIKQSPLFVILLFSGILFTAAAAGGRKTIYREQTFDPWKAPLLSILFTGLNDDIYPWKLFTQEAVQTTAALPEERPESFPEEETEVLPKAGREETAGTGKSDTDQETAADQEESGDTGAERDTASETEGGALLAASLEAASSVSEAADRAHSALERLEPFRESTREEYLNHISADIYGDAGVIRAGTYEFSRVDESYFDDALFIGDSRTVGLRDYTDLSEHGEFLCETSLTIYKMMEENFKGKGTVEEVLASGKYGKIYIMAGINELGRGTTEDFMEKYTEVIDRLRELAPDAKIFIQGIMRVSGKKHSSDAIFNNNNINARNNAIATLADNQQIFYIDVNEAVCDEEGNLTADYTHDQIHLLGMYNDLWKEFLLSHGVQ